MVSFHAHGQEIIWLNGEPRNSSFLTSIFRGGILRPMFRQMIVDANDNNPLANQAQGRWRLSGEMEQFQTRYSHPTPRIVGAFFL
jgi:hypothetical protein